MGDGENCCIVKAPVNTAICRAVVVPLAARRELTAAAADVPISDAARASSMQARPTNNNLLYFLS